MKMEKCYTKYYFNESNAFSFIVLNRHYSLPDVYVVGEEPGD